MAFLQRFQFAQLLKEWVLPLFIAASLAVALYYQALFVAPLHRHSFQTFYELQRIAPESLVQAWKPRMFSVVIAQWLKNYINVLPQFPTQLNDLWIEHVGIAQWTALWFLIISLCLVLAYRQRALYYILGTYAGVVFGYITGLDLRIYPWDLPALCAFTVFVALLHQQRPPLAIMLVVWGGMLFKETALVLCLFPLALTALSTKQRLLYIGVTALGCLGIKLLIDVFTHNTALGITMVSNSFYDEGSLLWWNVRELSKGYFLAINGGTFVAFLLLPTRHRTLNVLKLIALAFAAGNLAFGVFTEYRIWFEMIPFALYSFGVGLNLFGENPAPAAQPA